MIKWARMKYKAPRIASILVAGLLALASSAAAEEKGAKDAWAESCPCAPQSNGTWAQAIQELADRGKCFKNRNHGTRYAQFADYPSGSGITAVTAYDKSRDFFMHEMELICEPVGSGNTRALGLLVTMLYKIPGFGDESYNFRLSPSGQLLSAFLTRTSGKVIPGTNTGLPGEGDATVLDIKDPAVLERFRHVEDVWLRGMYWRKKKGAGDKTGTSAPQPRPAEPADTKAAPAAP